MLVFINMSRRSHTCSFASPECFDLSSASFQFKQAWLCRPLVWSGLASYCSMYHLTVAVHHISCRVNITTHPTFDEFFWQHPCIVDWIVLLHQMLPHLLVCQPLLIISLFYFTDFLLITNLATSLSYICTFRDS